MNRRRKNHNSFSLQEAFASMKAERSDYVAGTSNKFRKALTGVSLSGSGADYHIRNESHFLRILEQARAFDRNDQVVGQGITRLVNNVIRGGIPVDPDTGNPEADAYLKKKWTRWEQNADLCDSAGEHNLTTLAKMALRGVTVDGDTFVLPLQDGTIELVEAHRCRTPRSTSRNVVIGVLLDARRRRLEYWFTKNDIDPWQSVSKVSEITPYPARDPDGFKQVFHVFNPKRVSQSRGISACAPMVDTVGMHDDIQFATLVKQQASSCWTVLRSRPEGTAARTPAALGEVSSETLSDGTTRIVQGIAPGMEIIGEEGEKIEGFSPNIPSSEFFKHAMLILTFIAVNLELPVAVLLLDPSNTNFSGWRGAIDQARIGMMHLQNLMVDKFYDPIYLWKVRQWLAEDPIVRGFFDAGIDVYGRYWSPPYWPYIQPSEEADADTTIVANRLNSQREVLLRRGLRIEDVHRDTVNDNRDLILLAHVAAETIRLKYPDTDATWRDILRPTDIARSQSLNAPGEAPAGASNNAA